MIGQLSCFLLRYDMNLFIVTKKGIVELFWENLVWERNVKISNFDDNKQEFLY